MACIHLHPRSLSDIAHSIAIVANNAQASALFSAPNDLQRIPPAMLPVFRGLRSRICQRLIRLVTNAMSDRLLAHYKWLIMGLQETTLNRYHRPHFGHFKPDKI